MQEKLYSAYKKGLEKVCFLKQSIDGFPHITRGGKWLTNQNGHWTGGFWTGLIWLSYLDDREAHTAEEATEWAMRLKCRINDNTTHDQGFIFGPSCVFGYRITGNDDFLPLIHAGAQNMIDQYVPQVGLVQAWAEEGYDGISIVDTIMNLPILWISGELDDDSAKKEMCLQIARNIQKYAVRRDYSSYHVVRWDNDFRIYGDTHQGYSAESCWSRGQAWALYGFANMYRYTGEREFLDTAEKMAQYYWDNLNDDLMPAWDFTFRNDPSMPIDASAASIAASGFSIISSLYRALGENEKAELFGDRADAMLLKETELCLYTNMSEYGIIEHAVVDYPRKSGVDQSAMYGDYYYMEAIYRRMNKDDPNSIKLLY